MGSPGNSVFAVICSMKQSEMLPKVGFFRYSCSNCYVVMTSVHFHCGKLSKLKKQALHMHVLCQPLLMDTALPRHLEFFTVACHTEVFCLHNVKWLHLQSTSTVWVTQRSPDWLLGHPCIRTSWRGLCFCLSDHFGDDKRHFKRYSLFFCFKGIKGVERRVSEGMFVISSFRTRFWLLRLHSCL